MRRLSLIVLAALFGALGVLVAADGGWSQSNRLPAAAGSGPENAGRESERRDLGPSSGGSNEGTNEGTGRRSGIGTNNVAAPGGGRNVLDPGDQPETAMPSVPRPSRPTLREAPDRDRPEVLTPERHTEPVNPTSLETITFFLAKGEADACGRGCDTWISADGAIDANAAVRLRELLNRLGRRKLPIYFHSPGGSVEGALAIGRLMRARGLTAGVGWTVPQGCDRRQRREEACERLKRGGRDLPAALDLNRTMCNSACVYAIAGAKVREIAPNATLGIHSSSFRFVDNDGESMRPSKDEVRATVRASYERLERYLAEMDIDPALVAAAREISNDRVRFLTREEIWRFNIDRRAFIEDSWTISDSARTIRKAFVSESAGARPEFHNGLINLSCGSGDRLRVEFARELVPGEEALAVSTRLTVGGATRTLTLGRRANFSGSKNEFEVSAADVQPSFLLAAGTTISVAATMRGRAGEPTRSSDFTATLSTAGLQPALAKLIPLCGTARERTSP